MSKISDCILLGIGAFIAFIALFFIISLLAAWPVMLLWNWVAVALFKLPVISFWQSWGLLMLCGFLFKSSSSNSKS